MAENIGRDSTHIELAVRLVGPQLRVTKVVASSLRLLAECHHVWCVLEVPVLVCPELSSGTNTSLHFIDNQEYIVLSSNFTKAVEKGWARMIITTLRLNRLDNHCSRLVVVVDEQILNLSQAASLLLRILLDMLLERVLESWE